MKNKSLLLILALVSSLGNIKAQKYSKSQFTFFSYYVSIAPKVKQEFAMAENLVHIKTQKQQNKVDAMLIHTIYDVASKLVADSFNLFILPPNSLGDKAKYNDFGYPDITIQKAIRLSDTKYYLKYNVFIENCEYNDLGKKFNDDAFRPQIRITIEFFNKFGYLPIESAEGTASFAAPLNIHEAFFAGMNFIDDNIVPLKDEETLRQLITRAINDAIGDIKSKKK